MGLSNYPPLKGAGVPLKGFGIPLGLIWAGFEFNLKAGGSWDLVTTFNWAKLKKST